MRAWLWPVFAAVLCGCSRQPAGAGPDPLLGELAGMLAPAQVAAIHAAAGLRVSADRRRIEDPDCGDLAPVAELVDLNGDGRPEVFVELGNACTSGGIGRSLLLFVPQVDGSYARQLGFPAEGYTIGAAGADGYPDLEFTGMFPCTAVWRWDGREYQHACNRPLEPGGCAMQGNECR